MRIVFGQVFSDSKESYVREKLERGLRRLADLGAKPDDDDFSKQITNVIDHQLGNPVPIALPHAFYEITAEQEAQIEARKRCALATLIRESPLLKDEPFKRICLLFYSSPLKLCQSIPQC
jgi:hypothetical protein